MLNSKVTTALKVLGATQLLAIASVANAAITEFSDDFESYGTAGTPNTGLFNPPWLGFSDNCGFPGGYSFDPSTSGPQISALGYNGTDNQYWNVYANYDNAPCHTGSGPNNAEQIFVYRQQSFTGADTADGDTWVFTFDYREADVPPGGSTQVAAYLRVFDPIFNILYETSLDTSGSGDWQTGRLSVTLDPSWTSGNIQVGFTNITDSYEDSGMFYDNVSFAEVNDFVRVLTSGTTTFHPHHNDTGTSPFLDDVIRVRVHGSSVNAGDPEDLDTDNVDLASLRLGQVEGAAGEIDPNLGQVFNQDFNSDGVDDMLARFRMSSAGFECSDDSGIITGELTTGEVFAGVDDMDVNCNAQCH